MRVKHLAVVVICALLVMPSTLFASKAKYYRYKDNAGEVHLIYSISDQAIKYGYEVIDHHGRVLEKVEPALTKEEREARNEQRILAAKHAKQDQAILRAYPTAEAYVREDHKRIASIKGQLQNFQGLLKKSESTLAALEEEAAEEERAGKKVSASLKDRIAFMESKVESDKHNIDNLERKLEDAERKRTKRIKRYQEAFERSQLFQKPQ